MSAMSFGLIESNRMEIPRLSRQRGYRWVNADWCRTPPPGFQTTENLDNECLTSESERRRD